VLRPGYVNYPDSSSILGFLFVDTSGLPVLHSRFSINANRFWYPRSKQ
jgi:hypothetical protein